jgi:hypothetical protein
MSASPTPVLGSSVDFFDIPDASCDDLDERLSKLIVACRVKKDDRVIGELLREASESQLQHSMEQLSPERIRRIHRLGLRHNPLVDDHAFIHQRLEELLSTGPVALV